MQQPTFLVPGSVNKSGIFFCTPVDSEAVERSTVLRDLSTRPGTAILPDGVDVTSMSSWLSVDPKTMSQRDLSVDELCGGLQVASKLGDSLSTTFATALATKVLQSRDNLHVAEPKILSMDSSAQTEFFQQCMQAPSVDNRIEDLVKDWPEMLQQACYSWHISNTKSLILFGRTNSFHLSRLPTCSSSPGIRSLTLDQDYGPDNLQSSIAPALSALSNMEQLLLLGLKSEDHSRRSLSCIFSACAGLTLLTSLRLIFSGLTPARCHLHVAAHPLSELNASIACLPHLQCFHLRYVLTASCLQALESPAPPMDPVGTAAAAEPPRKRTKHAAPSACDLCGKTHPPPPDITSLDPLVATLAAAPALTALELPSFTTLPCTGLRGAFHKLAYLNLSAMQYSADAERLRTRQAAAVDGPFFSPLADLLPLAPLPNLRSFTMIDGTVRTPGTVSRLLRQLAAQPGLESLSLNTAAVAGGTARVLDAVEVLFQARRRSLTALDLRVGVQWLHQLTTTVNRTVAAAARLPALRSLRLDFAEAQARVQLPTGSATSAAPAVPFCLAPLTRLRRVDALELTYGSSLPKYWRRQFITAFLEVPLAPLHALTSLTFSCQASVDFNAVIVLTAPPLRQLSRLTRLRSLTLRDVTTHPGVSADIRGLLSPLTALTRIVLHVSPLTEALLRSFAAAASLLTELRKTEFVQPLGAVAAGTFLLALPALPRRGRYSFRGAHPAEPPLAQQKVLRQLRAAGADVCPLFSYLEYASPGEVLPGCLLPGDEVSRGNDAPADDSDSAVEEVEDDSDGAAAISDAEESSSGDEEAGESEDEEAEQSEDEQSEDEQAADEDAEEEDTEEAAGDSGGEDDDAEEEEPGIFNNLELHADDGLDEHLGVRV